MLLVQPICILLIFNFRKVIAWEVFDMITFHSFCQLKYEDVDDLGAVATNQLPWPMLFVVLCFEML